EAKEQKDREKIILSFVEEPELQVLNGRYGPYITFQKANYKITKGMKPEELTLEECRRIIEEADKEGKATGRGRRGASTKKAATTAAAGKSSAKKSTTKKSTAKKSTAKKSTAKKSTTKKSATAKTSAAKKNDSAKGE
ncbi:MAG: topoisomerase C-terminal repeat-containing protein, partial [bacterium]|nr:topoisomerase C-terminal repeat-containing protein [bacterium]